MKAIRIPGGFFCLPWVFVAANRAQLNTKFSVENTDLTPNQKHTAFL